MYLYYSYSQLSLEALILNIPAGLGESELIPFKMAKTVILIDDDQDDLDILKETLLSIDSSILCISFVYPLEAIRVITSGELIVKPDYIFTDINMPRMAGDQLLKEIRKYKELDDWRFRLK